MDNLQTTSLTFLSLTGPEGERYYADALALYLEAFDPDERTPFSGVWDHALHPLPGRVTRFIALLAGEKLVGMSWFCTFPADRLGYLGILAVVREGRGAGYGGTLLQRSLEQMTEDLQQASGLPPLAIFWEVRSLEDEVSAAEFERRRRRIRFYRKAGAQALPVDYVSPPVADGQPEVRYTLMAVANPPGAALDKPVLRRIAEIGLIQFCGAAPDSHYLRQAMQSIESL